MSMFFGPVSVSVGALDPILTTQFPNANVAVFINESPYTLKVDPGTGSYFVISAFTQDAVPLGNQFSGVLKVTASADVSFMGTPPVSVLYVQVYAKGEPLPGTYPAALARIMNVGNNVPLNASATSVANDTTTTGTSFVEASISSVQHVNMFTDGFLLLQKNAGSADQNFLAFIDLATGGHNWEFYLKTGASHALAIEDLTAGITALLLASDGTVTTVNKISNTKPLGGANQAYFEAAPSDGLTWDISELTADHGLAFVQGTVQLEVHPTKGIKPRNEGQYISGLSEFSGTVTGTYNHNLGATPDAVIPMQSVLGSQTMGFDTLGATTVHVTSGSGNAFTALAYQLNT